MDEVIKSLLVQFPMVVVLMYAIKVLYEDAKSERKEMRGMILALTEKLEEVDTRLDVNSAKLDLVCRACGADLLPPSKV